MKFFPTLATLVATTLAAKISTIYQFSNGTWLENLAPLRNGSLLVTVIGRAEVHIVNPTIHPATASLLTSFPSSNAVLGITELSHNMFAVAVGSVTPMNAPVPGSFSIWAIDLTCRETNVTKVVDLKNASLPNGITTLNAHTVLVADSWAGNILRVDLKSQEYAVVLQDQSLASNFSNPTLPLGVNGIKLHGHDLYYTNTVQNRLGRVKLDLATAKPVGSYETVVSGAQISQPDDFLVREDGSVLLARPVADTLMLVERDGRVEMVAQGGAVSGVTAVRVGRGGVVYASTGEGRVVAVEI